MCVCGDILKCFGHANNLPILPIKGTVCVHKTHSVFSHSINRCLAKFTVECKGLHALCTYFLVYLVNQIPCSFNGVFQVNTCYSLKVTAVQSGCRDLCFRSLGPARGLGNFFEFLF